MNPAPPPSPRPATALLLASCAFAILLLAAAAPAIERVDGAGFTLKSDAGEKDVAFNWVAVGRAKEHGDRPVVAIPDLAEDARIAAERKAAVEAGRPIVRVPSEGSGITTRMPGE